MDPSICNNNFMEVGAETAHYSLFAPVNSAVSSLFERISQLGTINVAAEQERRTEPLLSLDLSQRPLKLFISQARVIVEVFGWPDVRVPKLVRRIHDLKRELNLCSREKREVGMENSSCAKTQPNLYICFQQRHLPRGVKIFIRAIGQQRNEMI